MPWLTVLGNGSWQPRRGVRYTAGIHEVDEEIAEKAVVSGIKSLVITDEPPRLRGRSQGPLKPEDFEVGYGVMPEPVEEPEVEVEPEDEELQTYKCPICPERRPSAPALKRHVEMAHGLARAGRS